MEDNIICTLQLQPQLNDPVGGTENASLLYFKSSTDMYKVLVKVWAQVLLYCTRSIEGSSPPSSSCLFHERWCQSGERPSCGCCARASTVETSPLWSSMRVYSWEREGLKALIVEGGKKKINHDEKTYAWKMEGWNKRVEILLIHLLLI